MTIVQSSKSGLGVGVAVGSKKKTHRNITRKKASQNRLPEKNWVVSKVKVVGGNKNK